ncbi:hypothetical protein TNCV_5089631 [Trichonephila clavipes]|nr:hypothetical protein TNCV_5089631 [Trichonephila clavipes]
MQLESIGVRYTLDFKVSSELFENWLPLKKRISPVVSSVLISAFDFFITKENYGSSLLFQTQKGDFYSPSVRDISEFIRSPHHIHVFFIFRAQWPRYQIMAGMS